MPSKNGLSRIEAFKAFSTFFSSVIIASASIIVTLTYNNPEVRVNAVWALAKLKDENTENILLNVANNDTSEKVRDAASGAIEWMK